MANYDGIFSDSPYNHILRLVVTQTSQNVAANTSVVSWALYAIKNTTSGGFSSYANPWAVNINGVGYGGSFTHNFSGQPIGYTQLIASGTTTITHNADGTKTISVAGSATSSVWGSASNGGALALTTIPRASTPSFQQPSGTNVTAADAGTDVKILMNRASSSFTHDVSYSIGAASGSIATGVATDTTWTIPLSLLNQIPNATSGALTITVVTKSGATTIGSKSVVLTMRAAAGIVPDIGSVTHSEATTSPNVASIVGAYVKTISTLLAGMTGAAGVYGSTIASSKIELLGTDGVTVLWSATATGATAASGTTTAISQSGSLTLKATVTDTRGRSYSESVSVTVMNYAQPNISSFTAVRSSSGGTPIPAGTYIRADVVSAVQSLIVGTQKNNLKYRLRIRQRGVSTPWASITPAASSAGVGAVGFTDDIVVGTYAVANGWDVRFELEDNLGSIAVYETSVSTGGVLLFLDKDLDMIGVGKFPETYDGAKPTSIDALDYIYHRSGKLVLDVDNFSTNAETATGTATTKAVTPASLAALTSTTSRRGLIELATAAEVLAGSDAARAVAPSTFKSAREAGHQGVIPSSVVVGSGSASVAADGTITFTGASSVSLNDVFDGVGMDTYDIYVTALLSVAAVNVGVRLRGAGVDNTATNYRYSYVQGYAGTVGTSFSGGVSTWLLFGSLPNAARNSGRITLHNPGTTTPTTGASTVELHDQASGNMAATVWSHMHSLSTAYDGLTLFPGSGTITGTMKVVKVG